MNPSHLNAAFPSSLFQQVVETSHTGVWIIDLQGKTIYVNAKLSQLFGYVPAEMMGRSFYDFMSSEDRAIAEKNLSKRASGESENHDFRFLKKDGTMMWTILSTGPFYGEDGSLVGALAHVIDISVRKNIEMAHHEQLDQSKIFLDSLIENLPISVFVKDAKDLKFVRFNRAGEEMVGFPRSELIGKNDYDFFPKIQADAFIANDRAVLTGKNVLDIPEELIQRSDQTVRVLHTKKIPLFSKSGEPEYLLGISEDITEKKKIEEERLRMIQEEILFRERQRSTERDAFLVEASALISSLDYHVSLPQLARMIAPRLCDWCTISVFKENGSYERVVAYHQNPQKHDLLQELLKVNPIGASPDSGVRRIMSTGDSTVYSPATDEDLRRESSSEEHYAQMKKIGILHYMAIPILARHKVLGIIGFLRDTTDIPFDEESLALAEEIGRRVGMALENSFLYESARKAIEVRDEFLSIASHELKTPITSLRLQLEMAQRLFKPETKGLPSPERMAKVLNVSILQVGRLTRLIEDLLDVTRIQAGKVSFDLKNFNLSQLLEEIAERYEEQLQAVGCSTELSIVPQVMVVADAERIEQVITNLIGNAIKYAPGKKLKISLLAKDQAEVSIQDTGPGIAKDQQQHIFERFGRANASRNISGLGLGLYISKEIIEAHSGKIYVESVEGHGSKFIFTLPLASQSQGE